MKTTDIVFVKGEPAQPTTPFEKLVAALRVTNPTRQAEAIDTLIRSRIAEVLESQRPKE